MRLVIAEKPSVAKSLAAVLGATSRKDGYLEIKKLKNGLATYPCNQLVNVPIK